MIYHIGLIGFNVCVNFPELEKALPKLEGGILPDEAVSKPEDEKPEEKEDKIPIDDEKEQKIDEK